MPAVTGIDNQATDSTFRVGFELFLISFLILFLELAAIRWFPAHALYLRFFTTVVLLACFRGMSVGWLAACHRRNYLRWTPLILVVGMTTAHIVEITSGQFVQNGIDRPSPEVVFFGNAYRMPDLFRYPVPVEVMGDRFRFAQIDRKSTRLNSSH